MYNLFIVDDEQSVIEGLSNCIEWQKYNIRICGSASDGDTAYNSIVSLKPDIVITDIRMPGISGLDLIDKVNLEYSDIKFIVFSGYSEFEHAKHALRSNAVDYLVKPVSIEELLVSVTKAIELKEQDQYHLELIENSTVQSNELQEKFYYDALLKDQPLQLQKKSDDNSYLLVVIRIKPGSELYDSFAQAYHRIKRETTLGDSICYNLLKIHYDYVAIISGSERNSDLLSLVAKEQIIGNKDWFPEDRINDVYFGVSNICPLSNISAAYREALAAVSSAEYLSLPVLYYNEVHYSEVTLNAEQWMRAIDLHLKHRNIDAISYILDQIFDYCKQMHVSPIIVKKLDLDLIYHSIEMMGQSYKTAAKQIWGEANNFIKEVENLVSLEDSKHYLNTFYRELTEFISRKSIGLKARLIHKLKEYVKNNLNKPITLDDLADIVNRSPGYISMVFKKETGSTITQYITDQRISYAKELLLQSNYKISEIAHEIGYDEERYFYQVFKKETGLTAGDYRKLHLLDTSDENTE